MRYIVLLLTSFVTITALSAQITITEQDMRDAFSAGNETTSQVGLESGSIDIGQPGGGNTWDFSDVTFEFNVPWAAIDPSDGHEQATFPTADICVASSYSDQGITYEVWTYSRIEGGVHELGISGRNTDQGLNLITTNTPAHKFMMLPLTMSDSWQSDYTSVTQINGFVFGTSTISSQSTVDAYGTLLLPDGSSQEALRIRNVETSDGETTTSFLFVAKNGAYLGIEAEMADPGNSGVIAVIGSNYHPGFTQTSVDENGLDRVASQISTFPNPASSTTTLRYDLHQPGTVDLVVYDVNGQTVLRATAVAHSAGTYTTPIPCADLANGLYTVRLSVNGSTADHTFVVQR